MPIIVVRNWPSEVAKIAEIRNIFGLSEAIIADNDFKRRMSDALRKATAERGISGIDNASKVTVSFDAGHTLPVVVDSGLPDDKMLCIIVQKLFKMRGRDKYTTTDPLAEQLKQTAKKLLPNDWDVEVFVDDLFDPFNNSFTTTKE